MNNSYLSTLEEQIGEIDQKIQEVEEATRDPELKELAEKELEDLHKQKTSLQEAVEAIKSDEDSGEDQKAVRQVIVEIRSAAGGDEAGLFAADLYRMYLKFADSQGWKAQQLSINEGGVGNIKEVIFQIASPQNTTPVYSLLKFESGVHRVQRIPVTESSGRIHTSTATVAVLPKVPVKAVEIESSDLEIETYRSSGPGGQHANKTESAVRVIHKPTGVTVSCQESRSQLKNRRAAMDILRARLYQKKQEEITEEMGEKRLQQIGQGERAEKIRTYNFPQDRITDHRVNQSWHQVDKILDGELMELLKTLNENIKPTNR